MNVIRRTEQTIVMRTGLLREMNAVFKEYRHEIKRSSRPFIKTVDYHEEYSLFTTIERQKICWFA